MTKENYGGQRANMEDHSMVGTLACQAKAIWPKEVEFLRRLTPAPRRVLDLACGTGEILRRVRAEFAPEIGVGIDLFRGHLESAAAPVVQGDAYHLPFADGAFDLVLVRHVLQALPDPVGLLSEARRVGRRVHVLAEDYAGLFFDLAPDMEAENHFVDVAPRFFPQGTDLYQGRRAFRHLKEAGFTDISVEPLLVDTESCDRAAFAGLMRHWKAGYAATLAQLLELPVERVERRFDAMIEAIEDPGRYSSWLLFVLGAT